MFYYTVLTCAQLLHSACHLVLMITVLMNAELVI